jgi:hypothetical protein
MSFCLRFSRLSPVCPHCLRGTILCKGQFFVPAETVLSGPSRAIFHCGENCPRSYGRDKIVPFSTVERIVPAPTVGTKLSRLSPICAQLSLCPRFVPDCLFVSVGQFGKGRKERRRRRKAPRERLKIGNNFPWFLLRPTLTVIGLVMLPALGPQNKRVWYAVPGTTSTCMKI